ncbi:MAG: hypothetical protein BRC54_12010 [Cyanobacteria bacterium SW_7_48_12]|nr:MAG: hypothetical protein BRC54_12010 [Cyanobacteria bacterium SW_7_48_12]
MYSLLGARVHQEVPENHYLRKFAAIAAPCEYSLLRGTGWQTARLFPADRTRYHRAEFDWNQHNQSQAESSLQKGKSQVRGDVRGWDSARVYVPNRAIP